jgi:hypothetical protein
MNETRAEHPARFSTVGAANAAEQLAWLESQRARIEAGCEEQFDRYFRGRDAQGETNPEEA